MAAVACLGFTSCTGDLDVKPIDPNMTTEVTPSGLFNKCYANLAMAGNGRGDDQPDIDGLDGGTSGFIRQYWNSNELTTDEAICHWSDDGIQQFCYNTYDSNHPMLNGYYARLTTGISYCNQYINTFADQDATMTAEIRLVRALEYYMLMDAFGNIPFSTTLSEPIRMTRQEAYNWIEKELLELEPNLSDAKPKTDADLNNYCRLDKAACWMLLSRLYLNAEVYTGTAQWAKAAEYAKKVMDSSYKLNTKGSGKWSAYQMLFMGDNGSSGASQEAILPLLQDGITTTSWGTTLFLMASTWKADMDLSLYTVNGTQTWLPSGTKDNVPNDGVDTVLVRSYAYGTSEYWAGNRARSQLVAKFFPNNDAPQANIQEMVQAAGDDRALFFGVERELKVTTPTEYTSGYAVGKFRNTYSNGGAPHNSQFIDTDYFLMRSAEAYLIAAEADARLSGGTTSATGTGYINALRKRANTNTLSAYSLSQILDERSRELYYEGFRRTDLVRYGLFNSSSYLWDWKAGSQNGAGFDAHLNLFAIPDEDVNANPNLKQNPGY